MAIGGLLFCVIVVQNHATCFVAVQLYLKYAPEGRGLGGQLSVGNATNAIILNATIINNTTDPITITSTNTTLATSTMIRAGVLNPVLLCIFVLFVLSIASFVYWMDRKYLHTFISTETGPEFVVSEYRAATTDEQRADAFTNHQSYLSEIHDELKDWLRDNWEDWMANRPEWLTDAVIETIDDVFIPEAEVDRLMAEGGGKRRRSSAFGIVNGGGGEDGANRRSSFFGIELEEGGGRSKVAPITDATGGGQEVQ